MTSTKTLMIFAILVATSFEAESHDFNYLLSGDDWKTLFPTCNGTNQSPIAITTSTVVQNAVPSASMEMRLRSNDKEISYVFGHSINTAGQFSMMTLNDPVKGKAVFNSSGIHVHAPAEHTIDGVRGDAEVHIVHTIDPAVAGYPFAYAVYAIIFKVVAGTPNNFMAGWNPNTAGQTTFFNITKAFENQINSATGFYRYYGSLTTPPCTEGVNFFILNKIIDVSADQLAVIRNTFQNNKSFAAGRGNNRSTQPSNGRVVGAYSFDDTHKYGPSFVVNSVSILQSLFVLVLSCKISF